MRLVHWPHPTGRLKFGAHDEAGRAGPGGGEASVWSRPGAGTQHSACAFEADGRVENTRGTIFHGVYIARSAVSRMKFIFKNQCETKGDSFFRH